MRSQSRPTGRAQTKVRSYGTHVNETRAQRHSEGIGLSLGSLSRLGPQFTPPELPSNNIQVDGWFPTLEDSTMPKLHGSGTGRGLGVWSRCLLPPRWGPPWYPQRIPRLHGRAGWQEPLDRQHAEDGAAEAETRRRVERRSHFRRPVPAGVEADPLAHRQGVVIARAVQVRIK
jgi:hypothetical protein